MIHEICCSPSLSLSLSLGVNLSVTVCLCLTVFVCFVFLCLLSDTQLSSSRNFSFAFSFLSFLFFSLNPLDWLLQHHADTCRPIFTTWLSVSPPPLQVLSKFYHLAFFVFCFFWSGLKLQFIPLMCFITTI